MFELDYMSHNYMDMHSVLLLVSVYPTAGLNITGFSNDEYAKIETDLHTYTNDYRDGTS